VGSAERLEVISYARIERPPHRRRNLLHRDVAHAAVMPEPAGRLVARPAWHVGLGLDHGGERVERRPMPGAGGPEYADRRCAEGRSHVQQAGIVRYRHGRGCERQDGVAQIGAGEVAGLRCAACDFGGESLLAGAADHPDRKAQFGKARRKRPIGGPSLRRPDGAGGEHRNRLSIVRKVHPRAPLRQDLARYDELRQWQILRHGGALRQRKRGATIDHPGQRFFPAAQVIDETEPHFADKGGAAWNSGEKRRQRGFPGARHDQGVAVALGAQEVGEGAVLGKREALSGKVEHEALADPRHVVDKRRHRPGGQHVDRSLGKTLAQHANDRVAADEVADPHVGHDKDGTVVAHGRMSAKTSAAAQPWFGCLLGAGERMTCVSECRTHPCRPRFSWIRVFGGG
jgi:hypothetical protein